MDLIRNLVLEILKSDKSEIVVYHASPELDLKRISPRYSPKFGKRGIFITNSKQSIWNSWAGWAMSKPKRDKRGRTNEMYDRIAVYTIRIPKELFDESDRQHNEKAKQSFESGDEDAYGA